MDENTACVLRTVLRHYPCTKLCIKQHSGLSMSTVLRAVKDLAREGWLTVDERVVPQGGKPHAAIRPTRRPVYGAARTGDEWAVCALYLTGETETVYAAELPDVYPLSVVAAADEKALPLTAHVTTEAAGVAAYLAVHRQGVYVDEELRLYTPAGAVLALGDLPSPLLGRKRLDYREAFKVGTPQQKIRLKAELAQYIRTILQAEEVFFADGVRLAPEEGAAWASMRRLLSYL